MMVRRVLVTGSNGFVGVGLCKALVKLGCDPVCAVRKASGGNGAEFVIGPVSGHTNWSKALADCKTIVHLAARVHVKRDMEIFPLAAFRHVNVEGTLNLARQAAASGVRRFVFLSSIKAIGEEAVFFQSKYLASGKMKCFREDDDPAPQDAYAISKWEAEQGLLEIAQQSQMEVVIIRPPLVYGPGVKANFLTMMRWLNKGVPLPLGAIHNQRSLVALDNLVDLIITCLDHPAAANQVFLAGDGEDLSTTELLRRLGLAMGKPARLLPVPVALLKAGALLLGRRDMAQRLCESLQVDISKARTLLGWKPPISVDEGLRKTAQYFLAAATKK